MAPAHCAAAQASSAPSPFIYWFLPECQKTREQVHLARQLMKSILEEREAAKKAAEAEGRNCQNHDAIEWIEEAAIGRPFDAAAAQLALAMAVLHTTTELTKQAILDILWHPELMGLFVGRFSGLCEKMHGVPQVYSRCSCWTVF